MLFSLREQAPAIPLQLSNNELGTSCLDRIVAILSNMNSNRRFGTWIAYTTLIAGTLVLSGCSASTGAVMESSSANGDAAAYSPSIQTEDMAAVSMAKDSGEVVSGDSVITTGSATIKTSTPDTAAENFADKVAEMGGVVNSTWQSEWDGSVSASVDAQVPADRYEELVGSLSDFGKIIDQNTSRQDVGLQVTDLNARKDALETSITRLQELMEQATTTEELLQAEDMLTQRQSELDSLNSQLEWLEDQIDMSSIYVTFTQDSAAGSGFSWDRAWDLLLNSFRFVAYALVILVPWLIAIGLVVWLVRTLVRRNRRSRHAPEPTAPQGTSDDLSDVGESVKNSDE